MPRPIQSAASVNAGPGSHPNGHAGDTASFQCARTFSKGRTGRHHIIDQGSMPDAGLPAGKGSPDVPFTRLGIQPGLRTGSSAP